MCIRDRDGVKFYHLHCVICDVSKPQESYKRCREIYLIYSTRREDASRQITTRSVSSAQTALNDAFFTASCVSRSVKNSVRHTGVISAQVIELRDGRDHKTLPTGDTETDWRRHLIHVTHCPVVDYRSIQDCIQWLINRRATGCGFDVSEAKTAT